MRILSTDICLLYDEEANKWFYVEEMRVVEARIEWWTTSGNDVQAINGPVLGTSFALERDEGKTIWKLGKSLWQPTANQIEQKMKERAKERAKNETDC